MDGPLFRARKIYDGFVLGPLMMTMSIFWGDRPPLHLFMTHNYSSLQEILRSAGYRLDDTRVSHSGTGITSSGGSRSVAGGGGVLGRLKRHKIQMEESQAEKYSLGAAAASASGFPCLNPGGAMAEIPLNMPLSGPLSSLTLLTDNPSGLPSTSSPGGASADGAVLIMGNGDLGGTLSLDGNREDKHKELMRLMRRQRTAKRRSSWKSSLSVDSLGPVSKTQAAHPVQPLEDDAMDVDTVALLSQRADAVTNSQKGKRVVWPHWDKEGQEKSSGSQAAAIDETMDVDRGGDESGKGNQTKEGAASQKDVSAEDTPGLRYLEKPRGGVFLFSRSLLSRILRRMRFACALKWDVGKRRAQTNATPLCEPRVC